MIGLHSFNPMFPLRLAFVALTASATLLCTGCGSSSKGSTQSNSSTGSTAVVSEGPVQPSTPTTTSSTSMAARTTNVAQSAMAATRQVFRSWKSVTVADGRSVIETEAVEFGPGS